MFKALVLEEADGKVSSEIQSLDESRLPDGDVTVALEYSTLNYKDGMVLSGIAASSANTRTFPGSTWRGLSSKAAIRLQVGGRCHLDRLSCRRGPLGRLRGNGAGQGRLAGADAGQADREAVDGDRHRGASPRCRRSWHSKTHGLTPDAGEVLVTGAGRRRWIRRGRGACQSGYNVAASTGRAETHDYLKSLGAETIVARDELSEPTSRPLDSERWAGCVDSVGGSTLARVLTQMTYGGSVAAVGLAGGNKLETTVIPFLLRGVNLLGIDSVMCLMPRRREIWRRLATDLRMDKLDSMITDATLADLPRLAGDILKGQVRGRIVVDVSA